MNQEEIDNLKSRIISGDHLALQEGLAIGLVKEVSISAKVFRQGTTEENAESVEDYGVIASWRADDEPQV